MDNGAVNGWRLEYVHPPKHNKFYKILYKDNKIIFNWGRIGSPGQIAYREVNDTHFYVSQEIADLANDQKNAKLIEGYKEVPYQGSRKEDWEILFTRAALKAGVYQKPK